MNNTHPTIAIVAGEASGDNLAAGLVAELEKHYPDSKIYGIAGPRMIEAGCEELYSINELSVMGIVEVLKKLPSILKLRKHLIKHLLTHPPDIYIGVDAPDFNLPIEAKLKKHRIKTVHYNSPTVWAWRQNRLKKIARSTDLMLTLFPFEATFYEQHQIPVRYVGHSLADEIPVEIDTQAARAQLNLDPNKHYLAILPGSRAGELEQMGPVFLQTAQWCQQRMPQLAFISPMINQARQQQFNDLIQTYAPGLPITLFQGQAREVMSAADAVLLTAGTATLEAMLCKKAMVVAYRTSKINYQIGKRMIKVDHIALPNLLSEQTLAPEFIQDQVTVENLGSAILERLQNYDLRNNIQTHYSELHEQLRCDASKTAAQAIHELISSQS